MNRSFVPLLVFLALNHLAMASDVTSSVVRLGNPTEGTNLSGNAQNVGELQVFDGRIYLGSGNTATNPGKNILWSFNPATATFTNELLGNTEAFEIFRVYGDRMYAPASDPQTGDQTKYYYRDIGGSAWTEVSNSIVMAHIRDVMPISATRLIGVGNSRDPGTQVGVVVGDLDGGNMKRAGFVADGVPASWNDNFAFSILRYGPAIIISDANLKFGGAIRAFESPPGSGNYVFGSLGGISSFDPATELVDYSRMLPIDQLDVNLDSTDFMPAATPAHLNSAIPVTGYYFMRFHAREAYGSTLVYTLRTSSNDLTDDYYNRARLISSGAYVKTALEGRPTTIVLPSEPNTIPEDLLLRGSTFYILANERLATSSYKVSVWRSATPAVLSSWQKLFFFTSTGRAKSFEHLNDTFYFGLGGNHGENVANAGDLLKFTYSLPVPASTVAPTDIQLSHLSVSSDSPVGATIAMIDTSDADVGDAHTYTIVGGDAGVFQIDGTTLVGIADFDSTTSATHSVRIRSTDAGGLFTEKTFVMTVLPSTLPPATKRLADGAVILGDDGTAYGTGQDGTGSLPTSMLISADRRSATITGNAWKQFPLAYTVTPDTLLEVTISGSDTGEIIGIALDNDTAATTGRRAFLLGGSDFNNASHDTWSWKLTPTYTAHAAASTYIIPVGTYFTGTVANLGLIGDDDANGSTNLTFRNIRLYEKGTPEGYATISGRFDWGSTPVADRAAAADANRNGVTNLLEFAFNLNPLVTGGSTTLIPGTGTSGLPIIKDAPPLQIEYVRRKNSTFSYTVQFSGSLTDWVTAITAPVISPIDANWERCVVTDSAGSVATKRFGRVIASE